MTLHFCQDTDLSLERRIPATPAAVWRCWTEPALMKLWFCPKPWRVTEAVVDLRPGGRFFTRMQGPNGEGETCDSNSDGCLLEVEPERRLTFTDALRADYRPNGSGFMTATITMMPDGAGGTLYRAVILHNDAAAREKHEQMGFATGWGLTTDQLAALAETL
ncbi:SRPBCC family protein [Sagittula salina]|uniref:SRPBCC family protein n=1 Tax=Sagittula salina TaxID=2820268 RepID=A0A940S182_9RHOB|nr:SRPBCC family protein [Sagittula salina]MBP0483858.1 SRPBCC family protein [Sagittula salina]